jgi:hypothetical protein
VLLGNGDGTFRPPTTGPGGPPAPGPAAPPPDLPSRVPAAAPAVPTRAVPTPPGEALDRWFAAATQGGRRLAFAIPRPRARRGDAGWLDLPWAPDGAGAGGMHPCDGLALYDLGSRRGTVTDLSDQTIFGGRDLNVLAS